MCCCHAESVCLNCSGWRGLQWLWFDIGTTYGSSGHAHCSKNALNLRETVVPSVFAPVTNTCVFLVVQGEQAILQGCCSEPQVHGARCCSWTQADSSTMDKACLSN